MATLEDKPKKECAETGPSGCEPVRPGEAPEVQRDLASPGPPERESVPETKDQEQSRLGPYSRFELASIDVGDLRHLVAALRSHHQRTDSKMEYDERLEEVAWAVCLTLIMPLPELGVEGMRSPLDEHTFRVLSETGPQVPPEAQVCRLWLACCCEKQETDAPDIFLKLAGQPLWEPVQSLAYRALAYFGRRDNLVRLLPRDGPVSLIQADAWLEATHALDPGTDWLSRLNREADPLVLPDTRQRWETLLVLERDLVAGAPSESLVARLEWLISLVSEQHPRTFQEAVGMRLATRAAAALARVRLSQSRGIEDVLASPSGKRISVWELGFLRGLSRWQFGDHEGALSHMTTAFGRNPDQTPVRLALASFLAAKSPDKALGILNYESPTREILIARAALLARLGQHDAATEALNRCRAESGVGNEPVRHSWKQGRVQSRRQANLLRTALAEIRGDWREARDAWQQVSVAGIKKSLKMARELCSARRELNALGKRRSWRSSVLRQTLERGWRELSSISVGGDALFFRGAAFIDDHLDEAIGDFKRLLKQRKWVEKEQRTGAGRLVFVGDMLLRKGHADDAARAYELAQASSPHEANERLALAIVYSELLHPRDPDSLSKAARRAADLAPQSCLPQFLAALGMLAAGDATAAGAQIDLSEKLGAPQPASRCLRSLCASESQCIALTDEDFASLRGPKTVEAAIRFLRDRGDPNALVAFIDACPEDWVSQCPVDPARAARRLLASWCDQEKWDDALRFADSLSRLKQSWATELVTLMCLRHALERTMNGDFDQAWNSPSAPASSSCQAAGGP